MIEKMLISVLLIVSGGGLCFATTIDECFSLKDEMRDDDAIINKKICAYQKTFSMNKEDYLSRLASSMLKVGLISRVQRGNPDMLEDAESDLDYVLSKDPLNPLALVYRGLAYSLNARDSGNRIMQWYQVKKCISCMDMAVKNSRGNAREWYIRFLRANCYACLPSSFEKWMDADDDYSFVFRYIQANHESEPFLIAGHYYRGVMMYAKGDRQGSVEQWKKSVAYDLKYKTGIKEAAMAAEKILEIEGGKGVVK